MAFTLGPGATGDKFAAKQDVGTDIVYEISGDLRTISGSTDAYGSLAQGALSTSAAALLGPASGTDMIVDSMSFYNSGSSTRVITLYKTKNSTTYDGTTTWGKFTLIAGERAEWNSNGWTIYTEEGLPRGRVLTGGNRVANVAVSSVTGFEADTYLVGSTLLLPTALIRVGTRLRWTFDVVKTAACTGTPTVIIRVGPTGNITDTARLTFTFAAQTAAADRGIFDVWATVNVLSSSGVIQGVAQLDHQLATTGLNATTTGMQTLAVTSAAAIDLTEDTIKVGLSVNGTNTTAPAVWTITQVHAEADL